MKIGFAKDIMSFEQMEAMAKRQEIYQSAVPTKKKVGLISLICCLFKRKGNI